MSLRIGCILLALAAVVSGIAAPPPPNAVLPAQIEWIAEAAKPESARVEITGLPQAALAQLKKETRSLAQWQKLLSVYAEAGDAFNSTAIPPMLGQYQISEEGFRFTPAFSLSPGVKYRAVLRSGELGGLAKTAELQSAVYSIPPRPKHATTVVSEVYPTTDILPENLLKFYVLFSASMNRGHVYDHIRIRNAEGQKVDLAFLEIDEELWDPELRRLTLFIDPGRIKRGVRPLEEVGPALEEGKQYVLEIDQEMQDGAGNSLRQSFRKAFRVGPPDRTPPDPTRWQIKKPRAETRDALTIDFGEPLDHALARRLMLLTDAREQPIAGRVSLLDQERQWKFEPEQAWTSGTCRLIIGGMLEDLAGNSVGRPFEVDLFETVQRVVPKEKITLDIKIE